MIGGTECLPKEMPNLSIWLLVLEKQSLSVFDYCLSEDENQ